MAAGAAVSEVYAVITQLGILHKPSCNTIIINKGLDSLETFYRLYEDSNVSDMAKCLATCPQGAYWVILGTVVIKQLQTLIYWVKEGIKINQPLDAANFTPTTINSANAKKKFCKKLKNKSTPNISSLGNSMPPTSFSTTEQQKLFQIPLAGSAYEINNTTVFCKLKSFLIDGPTWAWIKAFDDFEDGQSLFTAWTDHYNGQYKLSKIIFLAKAQLKNLFYKHKSCFSF
eukprot:9045831-Ditylum_brightwellii.AAC.1